jgi:hemolysin-activating ACP:hemolysin acyltransferase
VFFKSGKSRSPSNEGVERSPTPPPLPEVDAGQGDGSEPSSDAAAQFKRNTTKSKHLHASFGEIVALMMRSAQFKTVPLAGLDKLVVPPIASGQFMIAEAQNKRTGLVAPAAAILWASVSDEIDKRLSEGGGKPLNLAPADWKSGDNVWLVVCMGNETMAKALVQHLQKDILKGRPLKSLAINANVDASPEGVAVK